MHNTHAEVKMYGFGTCPPGLPARPCGRPDLRCAMCALFPGNGHLCGLAEKRVYNGTGACILGHV